MFGRVRRAVDAHYPGYRRAAAVLRVYSPDATAGALAIGMGAAAVGSGSATVTLPDGRQVSAVSEAVDRVLRWGRRDQARYVQLPPRVLAIVLADQVVLREWTIVGGAGRPVATWTRGSFTAAEEDFLDDRSVRVVLDGKRSAILSGARGPLHPSVRRTIRAIVEMSSSA
jgi:hypothetical protein